ncbi:putative amino acid permease YhdG [bacterium HR37]|nr:putative amino acid permease YhdG [bacterium HR37]
MFLKRLLVKKPIAELEKETEEKEHTLRRVLGPLNLISLGIGAIIGAGIFVLTGQAAAQYAGPAVVVSFILSGISCALTALCYAEMASMVPVAGSAYTYAYVTLGEFFAWVIGWDLILEYLFGASTVAVGWSGYMVSLLKDFGILIPDWLSNSPLVLDPDLGWVKTGAVINLPAVLVILGATFLLVLGIRESAFINNLVVFIKILVLLLFIIIGVFFINPQNWSPFIPSNNGAFGHFGWSGILRGAGVIFFAYIGFDAVSTAAQETLNPQRNMPVGILGSLGVSTLLYVVVSMVLTGMVRYDRLLVPDPIAVAVDSTGYIWLSFFVKVGAVAGLSSVILVMLLGQSRIFYSMARDGLMPKKFALVHPVFRTPYITTVITGVVAAFLAGIFPIGILGELVSIGTLLAFVIVSIGVLVLRYTNPELRRPFKTPLFPLVPVLGAAISLLQMLSLPLGTWLRLIIWMFIGFLIYFFYGSRHSLHGR